MVTPQRAVQWCPIEIAKMRERKERENKAICARLARGMYHHFVVATYTPSHILQFETKRKSFIMRPLMRRVDSDSFAVVALKEVRSNHSTGPKGAPESKLFLCGVLSRLLLNYFMILGQVCLWYSLLSKKNWKWIFEQKF